MRAEAEADAALPDAVAPIDPPGPALGRAVEHLVLALPPMERACVLLKDVFDYSLDDIATLVDSTVGGVKAALSRGRGKLAAAPSRMPPRKPRTPEIEQLLRLYVDRFNPQDWDGLRTLIAADARLRVADAFSGPLAASPYFGKWPPCAVPWRMAAGEVDGEPAVIILQRLGDRWAPKSAVMLELTGPRLTDRRLRTHHVAARRGRHGRALVGAAGPYPHRRGARNSGKASRRIHDHETFDVATRCRDPDRDRGAAQVSRLSAHRRLPDAARRRDRPRAQRGAAEHRRPRDDQGADASGFEVASQGDNGAVCMVMRGFSAPPTRRPPFRDLVYDPTVHAPICFTAPPPHGAAVLRAAHRLAIAGKDPEQIAEALRRRT